MNLNRWAPAVAAVAVLGVVAAVTLLFSDGRTTGPPLLRIAGVESRATAALGTAALDSAAPQGATGGYRLSGDLPDGPTEARVRDLPAGAAPAARVRALASALGESAAPVRDGKAWRTGTLVVADEPGNPWSWGAGCGPDAPVSSESPVADGVTAPACVGSGSSGSGSSGSAGSGSGFVCPEGSADCLVVPPAPPPPPAVGCGAAADCPVPPGVVCPESPPGAKPACGAAFDQPLNEEVAPEEAQALAATAAVRDALDLEKAPTRVEGFTVAIEPLAGSLPTTGLATVLQLSTETRLVGATGWLSTGKEGERYPLRTARDAFDDLPVVAMGAPCDALGCPDIRPAAITGARLGLSRTDLAGGAAALVPAWLFAVEGSPEPLVAVAVADRFLAGPGTTEPGTDPKTDPGTGPGVEPAPATAAPVPPPPPPPPVGRPAPAPGTREPLTFDAVYDDADPKVLLVRYGDSGSCPSQDVRHEVVEDADRIVVTLTRSAQPGDLACTADYRAVLVPITLAAPRGDREVLDASRKEPVPVSTGSPPFG